MNKIVVRCDSDISEKCFRDAMSNLRWIQNSDVNQRSLTDLDLLLGCNTIPGCDQDLDCGTSIATSTAHVFIDLNLIGRFELEIRELILTVSVNQDGTRYLEMEILELINLTSEKLEFIHGCHYTRLKVWSTSLETNNRLVDIVWNSPKLEDLHIHCDMENFLTIINLFLSTREMAFQDGDSPSLRTLTVIVEAVCKSTITFLGASQLFDMRSSISLSGNEIIPEVHPKFEFLRRYGWSIEDLEISLNFNEQLAALLWDSIQEQGSRIKFLSVEPTSPTTSGLNVLDQIIRILPRSTCVRLDFYHLEYEHPLENTLHLLRLYKERVNHLGLFCDSMRQWLPRLTQDFPDRTCFPVLKSFTVGCYNDIPEVPKAYVPWIVTMISTPPEQVLSSTRLGLVQLDVSLQHDDWRTVVETLDLSTLEELFVAQSNFSFEELELLVNRIVESDVSQVRLTTVRVDLQLLQNNDVTALCKRLGEKAPNVQIQDWVEI
ncbi:hypothetical protein BGZ65_001499 [Modicella reniformis]|uniref:Uncharacterized protein n=1 Tax=Modicella reniformis TaxID=1440133 RepID=A0A9P6MJ43_9FUNG|nr:hypothetical protein BGZ65_001499 [Modicella reniformis]